MCIVSLLLHLERVNGGLPPSTRCPGGSRPRWSAGMDVPGPLGFLGVFRLVSLVCDSTDMSDGSPFGDRHVGLGRERHGLSRVGTGTTSATAASAWFRHRSDGQPRPGPMTCATRTGGLAADRIDTPAAARTSRPAAGRERSACHGSGPTGPPWPGPRRPPQAETSPPTAGRNPPAYRRSRPVSPPWPGPKCLPGPGPVRLRWSESVLVEGWSVRRRRGTGACRRPRLCRRCSRTCR
jgi:hypothetical protein